MKILECFPRRYYLKIWNIKCENITTFAVGKAWDCSEDDAQCGKWPGRQVQRRYEEGAFSVTKERGNIGPTPLISFILAEPHAKVEDFKEEWDLPISKTNLELFSKFNLKYSPKVLFNLFQKILYARVFWNRIVEISERASSSWGRPLGGESTASKKLVPNTFSNLLLSTLKDRKPEFYD